MNPTESDARARCDSRGPQDGEHVLVIMFRMHGTIDPGTGSVNPHLPKPSEI